MHALTPTYVTARSCYLGYILCLPDRMVHAGGTLVAGTSQGNVVGWQLEQAESSETVVPELAGVPATAVTEGPAPLASSAAAGDEASMLDGMDISKDALQSTARATDAAAKPRAMFDVQRSGSIPERQGLPAPGRFPRIPGVPARPNGRVRRTMHCLLITPCFLAVLHQQTSA